MYATCHTEGCANAGITIDVGDLTYEMDGETYVSGVQCGVCQQPISDVTDQPTDQPL